MDFAVWSRATVSQRIQQACAISIPIRSVGDLPRKKPIKKAYEQRPEAVKLWLDEAYSKIAKRAVPRVARFTGLMRPRWSTPMCVAVALRRRENAGGLSTGYASVAVDDCHDDQPRLRTLGDHRRHNDSDQRIELLGSLIKDARQ